MSTKNHNMLERAVHILEFVAERPRGATLTEVCNALSLPKSSAHNLMTTYENLGYLTRKDTNAPFTLGIKAFETGLKYVENDDFYRYSRGVLEDLVGNIDETAHLATLEGTEIVYISKYDCSHAVRMISTIGKRVPAHATAIGKALLSGLTDQKIRTLYQGVELKRLTKHTITNIEDLIVEVAEVRHNGFATEWEESTPGVHCIAVPIQNRSGTVVSALSIAVPITRSEGGLERFLPALQTARHQMEIML